MTKQEALANCAEALSYALTYHRKETTPPIDTRKKSTNPLGQEPSSTAPKT